MAILVTGATGFIGSRLALDARHRGNIIATGTVTTAAERERLAELQAAGIEVVLGDLQDAQFANRIVEGCEIVIHLAAAQHEANVPDSYFHDVNVEATRTLLKASVSKGVRR